MKNIFLRGAFCAAASMALSGCATVFEGTSQEISVVSNPSGATCAFERQGMEVGRIQNTPGTANIRKSKYDLTIRCSKPGFAEATYLNHSGTTATIGANIAADLILTGGLSSIVDSADGADNKYDSAVNVSLVPLTPVAALGDYGNSGNTQVGYPIPQPVRTCSKEAIETARQARASGFTFPGEC